MRRRIPALLCLVLLLLLGAAAAEEPYFAPAPALACKPGQTVRLGVARLRSAPDGQLTVETAGGKTATSVSPGRGGTVYIPLRIEKDLAESQVLEVWFTHDGKRELQGTCLLAVDDDVPAVKSGPAGGMRIAVTFDAAIGVGRLEDLLDLLDRYGIRCTFFIQGTFAERHPEETRMIAARGHELANHTMNHPSMPDCDDAKILREIAGCNQAIEAVTGRPVRLYRPPGGYHTWRDRSIARALGCEVVNWTFDSMDGFPSSTRLTVRNTMYRNTAPGAIILMHVYGTHTLSVLEEYIPDMQALGYTFVTVGELLGTGED